MKITLRLFLILSAMTLMLGCNRGSGIEPTDFPTYVEKNGLSLSLTTPQSPDSPLSPVALVQVGIPERGRLRLALFNSTGFEINLVVDAVLDPGTHDFAVEFVNDDGQSLKTGLYIIESKYRDIISLQLRYLQAFP